MKSKRCSTRWNALALMVFILFSCSENENQQGDLPLIISLDDSDTFSEGGFFEIFELREVKELTYNPNHFLAEVSKLVVTEDGFLVLDKNLDALFRYDSQGQLLNRICKIGDGPAEMPGVSDFVFDPGKEELYVIASGSLQVKVYKPDGTFVRNLKMGVQADHIALIGDHPVLTLTYFNPFYRYLGVFDQNGDTLKTAFPFPKETFPIGLHHISGNLTAAKSTGILVNEPASSTVYAMNEEMDLNPKYKFTAAGDFWPEKERHKLNAYFEKLATGDLSFLSKYYGEGGDCFFFGLNAKKSSGRQNVVDPRIGYYDHRSGKSNLSKSQPFLINMKGPLAVEGNSFYAYISKIKLSELFAEDEEWKNALAPLSEILVSDKEDYDTPVLLKFGIK